MAQLKMLLILSLTFAFQQLARAQDLSHSEKIRQASTCLAKIRATTAKIPWIKVNPSDDERIKLRSHSPDNEEKAKFMTDVVKYSFASISGTMYDKYGNGLNLKSREDYSKFTPQTRAILEKLVRDPDCYPHIDKGAMYTRFFEPVLNKGPLSTATGSQDNGGVANR